MRGLFVGLITLDCVYQVHHVPEANEKTVAQDSWLGAGGPATNAAVTFSQMGNAAQVLGALGQHPMTSLVRADLAHHEVDVLDLSPAIADPPPLSTILVTAATGDRAVISRNAVGRQIEPPLHYDHWLRGVDVVLVDGHQMALGRAVATLARQRSIPVVIDAGSWKPGFETVLPLATSVIAAAKFRLPDQPTATETLQALHQMGIPEVAMTHGPDPIQLWRDGDIVELPVPAVAVTDTLGAGDTFHGAFCHYRLSHGVDTALTLAAQVAAQSCQQFGPRSWCKVR